MEERITVRTVTKKQVFNGGEIETTRRETRKPLPPTAVGRTSENQQNRWTGLEEKRLERSTPGFCPEFNPGTYLPEPGLICEQDVAITLHDGALIHTEIPRPPGQYHSRLHPLLRESTRQVITFIASSPAMRRTTHEVDT